MADDKARRPRAGDLLDERALAAAARAALDAHGVTQKEAAAELALNRSAVAMALNPERYPDRGHAPRRAIIARYAGLDVEGPLFRLRKRADAEAGGG